MSKITGMREWNGFDQGRSQVWRQSVFTAVWPLGWRREICIWEWMDLGWGDEERWRKPCRQGITHEVYGNLAGERDEEKYFLLIVFYAGRERRGLLHITVRGSSSLRSRLPSQTKMQLDRTREERRGPAVGWLRARWMMRLSCTLHPYRAFPVWSELCFPFLQRSTEEVDICK